MTTNLSESIEHLRKVRPFTSPPELELKEKKEFICKRLVGQVFDNYLNSIETPTGIFTKIIIIDRDSHKMRIVETDELKNFQNKYDLSNCFVFKCSYNSKEDCQYVDFWTNKKD